jgi:hypothetical protein
MESFSVEQPARRGPLRRVVSIFGALCLFAAIFGGGFAAAWFGRPLQPQVLPGGESQLVQTATPSFYAARTAAAKGAIIEQYLKAAPFPMADMKLFFSFRPGVNVTAPLNVTDVVSGFPVNGSQPAAKRADLQVASTDRPRPKQLLGALLDIGSAIVLHREEPAQNLMNSVWIGAIARGTTVQNYQFRRHDAFRLTWTYMNALTGQVSCRFRCLLSIWLTQTYFTQAGCVPEVAQNSWNADTVSRVDATSTAIHAANPHGGGFSASRTLTFAVGCAGVFSTDFVQAIVYFYGGTPDGNPFTSVEPMPPGDSRLTIERA